MPVPGWTFCRSAAVRWRGPFSGIPDPLGQHLLHKHMDVLGVRVERECTRFQIVKDARQTRSDSEKGILRMKMWAGRFSKEVDDRVNDFNSSIRFDARMFEQDIQIEQQGGDRFHLIAQIEPDIERDLVVAGTRGVQPFSGIPDPAGGDHLLDRPAAGRPEAWFFRRNRELARRGFRPGFLH